MCIPIFLGSSSSRFSTLSPQLQENEHRIRNYVGNSITKIVPNRTSYILVLLSRSYLPPFFDLYQGAI